MQPHSCLFNSVVHNTKKLKQVCSEVTNLKDSKFKSRDVTLLIKYSQKYSQQSIVKAMVFPAVMYGCEGWTVKKAESQRIDASNCDVGEDSQESLGQHGDQTSQS